MMLTTHFHVVPRLKCVELCLHSIIHFRCWVLVKQGDNSILLLTEQNVTADIFMIYLLKYKYGSRVSN